MKAEDIDGATQILQAALGQDPGTFGDKRAIDDPKIGKQLAAVTIGRCVADGMLRGVEMIERPRRRR
jgi:hypothetical protein